MNEQQKELLKAKYLAFREAYDDFSIYAYRISEEVGDKVDLISIDRLLDIKDALIDMGVLEYEEDND